MNKLIKRDKGGAEVQFTLWTFSLLADLLSLILPSRLLLALVEICASI